MCAFVHRHILVPPLTSYIGAMWVIEGCSRGVSNEGIRKDDLGCMAEIGQSRLDSLVVLSAANTNTVTSPIIPVPAYDVILQYAELVQVIILV